MQGLPEIGDVLDETYEIEAILGKGGFGAVYLARQLSMDRQVALKVLVANAMKVEQMSRRFRREVHAVRNLQHPNTIRVYDFRDRSDGLLYYAMEYVQGSTLEEIVGRDGPLPPRRVVHVVRQVLKSLAEAHENGVIHRDLKPPNIMLVDMPGEPDFVKVLDFGIAKIIDGEDGVEREKLTNAGVLVGTLNYMAPEQIAGDPVGPPADLYALALIAVEMLTGQAVFSGTGRWEILHKQISDEPVEVPEVVLDSKLGPILERGLEKKADRRYQSALEMLSDLQARVPYSIEPLVDPDEVEDTEITRVASGSIASPRTPSREMSPTPLRQEMPTPANVSDDFEEAKTQVVDPSTLSRPRSSPPSVPDSGSTPDPDATIDDADHDLAATNPALDPEATLDSRSSLPVLGADDEPPEMDPEATADPDVTADSDWDADPKVMFSASESVSSLEESTAEAEDDVPTFDRNPEAPPPPAPSGPQGSTADQRASMEVAPPSPEPAPGPQPPPTGGATNGGSASVPPMQTPFTRSDPTGAIAPAPKRRDEPSSSNRAVYIAGGALALFVLGAVGFFVVLMQGEPDPVDDGPVTVTRQDDPPDDTKPKSDEPEKVAEDDSAPEKQPEAAPRVRLVTPGVTAEVYDGDERLGATPLTYEAKEEKTLAFRAEGHDDAEATVGPESDEVLEVELKPTEEDSATEKRVAKKTGKRPGRRPAKVRKDNKNEADEETNEDSGWVDVPVEPTKKDDKKDDSKEDPEESDDAAEEPGEGDSSKDVPLF